MFSERDIGKHVERSLLDAGAPVNSADVEDANEWKHLWRFRSFESRWSERFAAFKEWCKAQADDQCHVEWLKNSCSGGIQCNPEKRETVDTWSKAFATYQDWCRRLTPALKKDGNVAAESDPEDPRAMKEDGCWAS